jgi:hypothetical protein
MRKEREVAEVVFAQLCADKAVRSRPGAPAGCVRTMTLSIAQVPESGMLLESDTLQLQGTTGAGAGSPFSVCCAKPGNQQDSLYTLLCA